MAAKDQTPVLDILVDEQNLEPGLKELMRHIKPQWTSDDIKTKRFASGHINQTLAVYVDEENKPDWVVVRVFGTKLDMLDKFKKEHGDGRKFEFDVNKLFAEIGCSPRLLGIFLNGMVMEFVEGVTCSWRDMSPFRDNDKLFNAVARGLAKIHCKATHKLAVTKYELDKVPASMYDKMRALAEYDWGSAVLVDEEATKWYNDRVCPLEVARITELARNANIPTVFGHLDANPTNMIYLEGDDRIVFVDFEAAGFAKPVMDLGAFLDGVALGLSGDPAIQRFSTEKRRDFISVYLAERNRLDAGSELVEEKELETLTELCELHQMGIDYAFQMIMASLVQTGVGKDYLEAGIRRLANFKKNRERFYSAYAKYSKIP